MTALSAFVAQAKEDNPGLPLDLDGTEVTLRSSLMLDDAELKKLSEGQKRLTEMDGREDGDPAEMKAEMVNLLAVVSTNPKAVKAALSGQPMAVVVLVFEAYADSTQDAAKSKSDPAPTE